MKKYCFSIYFIVAILAGCNCHHADSPMVKDAPHPGMVKIASAGKSFQQGWNDPSASPDEKPGMLTSFTYDFWIDTVEVTQKQFSDLMGRFAVSGSSASGAGDNYPVYNVSWLDAALYCNSRSKDENLDTVYIYSGKTVQANGSVSDLVGIRCDFAKDGYRLPTEAEWEFAAREASSPPLSTTAVDSTLVQDRSWFLGNAGGKTHPVASKAPNRLGLYDMAGNVFEWTNDWKTSYTGVAIENSAGGENPGRSFEKIIKGGAFNYGIDFLRPSHRSATYATAFSTCCNYVGFRCARGPIPNPHYIGAALHDTVFNPVGVQIGRDSIFSFTGSMESKLVFVNVTGQNRTLVAIDFSGAHPFPLEFTDDESVYHPVISPNGRFVAYCSRDVGLSVSSKITIRSLDSLGTPKVVLASDPAYCPRWWVDPATGDTDILYTNSAIVNENSGWDTTKTFVQKITGGQAAGSPRVIIPNGGFHDGVSKNGRYAITSYTRLLVRDLISGQQSQLFLSPQNGKSATGSSQVCNGSISPDTGNNPRCLFLDFGSSTSSTVTGCSYGIHQYLFMSKIDGTITGFIHNPPEDDSWDTPKWSNHVSFAVACGANSAGQSHTVYLINLNTKAATRLVDGIQLEQPYFWIRTVQIPDNLSLDSLGQYATPPSNWGTQVMQKLIWFWQAIDSLQVVGIGSSEMLIGFDPSKITGYYAYNMANNAADLPLQKIYILNYLLNHCSKLKVVLSSLDAGWLADTIGNPNDPSVGHCLQLTKGYIYDENHAFWPPPASEKVKNAVSQFPSLNLFDHTLRGWRPMVCNPWTPTVPIADTSFWAGSNSLQQNIALISLLADSLRSRGVYWIVINFPVNPNFKNTPVCGAWGPSWQTEHDLFSELQAIHDRNPYFIFYDANLDGNHDYTDTETYDWDHLCVAGAGKLSRRIDSIIHLINP